MLKIDINKIKNIKDELDTLDEDEVAFVEDNNETKYVIMPISQYDEIDSFKSFLDEGQMPNSNVKIITNASYDLTYDEYEKIRKQLIEVIDKTLKPNPEKFN